MKIIRNKELLKKGAAYSLCGFGQNIISGLVTGYIMVFFTDALGISAVTAGIVMFGARIIDIFSDPLLGKMIDNTAVKYGSLRGYLLFVPWLSGLITVACFYSPYISVKGRTVYAAEAFVLWGVVYTLVDVPYWGIPNSLTSNSLERDGLLTAGRMFSVAGSGLLTIAVPLITGAVTRSVQSAMPQEALSTDVYSSSLQSALRSAFFNIAVVCSAVGAPLASLGAFFLRKNTFSKTDIQKRAGISLFRNRRLVVLASSFVLGSLQGVYGFMYPYLSKYTLAEYTGSTDSWASVMSVLTVPLGILGSVLLPYLCKKISRNRLYLFCQCFSGAVLILMFFIGCGSMTAVAVQGVGLFILGFPSGVRNVLTYSMIGEAVQSFYSETGIRSEGVSFAVQTFVSKFSMALCQLAVGLCLGFSSYSPNAYFPASEVKSSLFFLASLGAGISSLLSAVPVFFYNLRRNDNQTDVTAD